MKKTIPHDSIIRKEFIAFCDPSKENNLDLYSVYSKEKALWQCSSCPNQWITSLGQRSKGRGCPKCALVNQGKKASQRAARGNPIPLCSILHAQFLRPDDEKDSPYLTDYSQRSSKNAWWKCLVCKHEWKSTISNRTAGKDCPLCANKARGQKHMRRKRSSGVIPCDSILHQEFIKPLDESHPALLSEYSYSSHAKAYWRCSDCSFVWVASIGRRTSGRNCPDCARKLRPVTRTKTLSRKNPIPVDHIMRKEFLRPVNDQDPSSLDDYPALSARQMHWQCQQCEFQWIATIANRTNGTGCPACAYRAKGLADQVRAAIKNPIPLDSILH